MAGTIDTIIVWMYGDNAARDLGADLDGADYWALPAAYHWPALRHHAFAAAVPPPRAPEIIDLDTLMTVFAARYGSHVRSVLTLAEDIGVRIELLPGAVYHVRRTDDGFVCEYDPAAPHARELVLRACAYALEHLIGRGANHIPIGVLAARLSDFCSPVAEPAAANQQHGPRLASVSMGHFPRR